jgi:hypothetical protein
MANMDVGVRKLPKKRKFDPSELEENNTTASYIPVSVVQSVMSAPPQATAVDYSCPTNKQNSVDLSECVTIEFLPNEEIGIILESSVKLVAVM